VYFLTNTLAILSSQDQTDWSKYLKCCAFAYNTTINKTINESPFYLIYGREPILPSDITFGTYVNEPETLMDHKISFIKRLSNAYHLTFVQRCAAIRDYKMYYDQSQKEVKFKIDDLVMVFGQYLVKVCRRNCFLSGRVHIKLFQNLENLHIKLRKVKRNSSYMSKD